MDRTSFARPAGLTHLVGLAPVTLVGRRHCRSTGWMRVRRTTWSLSRESNRPCPRTGVARRDYPSPRRRATRAGSTTEAIARAATPRRQRVDEETGERKRFSSKILPASARRSPEVTEVLPILYVDWLSTGDFGPAPRGRLGEDASGLSANSIQRLTEASQAGVTRSSPSSRLPGALA